MNQPIPTRVTTSQVANIIILGAQQNTFSEFPNRQWGYGTMDLYGKKTEDTLEVQRIKSQIRSLDRANERDYIEIGKKIYEKFKAGEVADLEYIALCESIEKREEEAVQCQEEIRKIQEV